MNLRHCMHYDKIKKGYEKMNNNFCVCILYIMSNAQRTYVFFPLIILYVYVDTRNLHVCIFVIK